MRKESGIIRKRSWLCGAVCVLLLACLLPGCGKEESVSTEGEAVGENTGEAEPEAGTEQEQDAEEAELERLARGDVELSAEQLAGYAADIKCLYDKEAGEMTYSLDMPQIPRSDDANLYLFALECYEDESNLTGEPVACALKDVAAHLSFPYEQKYRFMLFVPALLLNGQYTPLGSGVYLSNPGALADNQDPYPEMASKKGLLLDPALLSAQEMEDLGVKYAIYNIPLSIIMGNPADESRPTIVYQYEGTDYYFDQMGLGGYDSLFTSLSQMNLCVTAVVLNDWNDAHTEMIHPEAANHDSGAYYYMFNTAQEDGVKELEAVASFLTERYSGGEYGLVHNWVVANEINQARSWNYMDTDESAHYTEEFEKALRIFYQAAKSQYANARVYFSIDHEWNSNGGDNSVYFNGRDIVSGIQEAALKHGNYDWGLAIHPYPDPLTRVNYWSQQYDKTQDAQILSIMNLNVLTDFLQQEKYLDTAGEVRSITITELGFSSRTGEKLQAAAYAYCYYITEANPYVDAFLLNRQTDAPAELKTGLAFGMYEYDHTEKYLREVFRCIDTEEAEPYLEVMLNILGAESLEEALQWAQ